MKELHEKLTKRFRKRLKAEFGDVATPKELDFVCKKHAEGAHIAETEEVYYKWLKRKG